MIQLLSTCGHAGCSWSARYEQHRVDAAVADMESHVARVHGDVGRAVAPGRAVDVSRAADVKPMIGVTISGYCQVCRAKFGVSMTPGGITPQVTYNLLELSYEEHYRATHVDSWQKLARDAMQSLSRYARADLFPRLSALEAKCQSTVTI